ncbi:hypothetical protein HG530_014571 [Fusarium avenaceum]|nr:hypothetical protein HG530_014571 [Fusarium avenaceum]KIL83591.1 hypothetical protein FAVG1_13196 [Fusarium avenaceum]
MSSNSRSHHRSKPSSRIESRTSTTSNISQSELLGQLLGSSIPDAASSIYSSSSTSSKYVASRDHLAGFSKVRKAKAPDLDGTTESRDWVARVSKGLADGDQETLKECQVRPGGSEKGSRPVVASRVGHDSVHLDTRPHESLAMTVDSAMGCSSPIKPLKGQSNICDEPSKSGQPNLPATSILPATSKPSPWKFIAVKDFLLGVWQEFTSLWSTFYDWFPFQRLQRPIGYILFASSLYFIITYIGYGIKEHLCNIPILNLVGFRSLAFCYKASPPSPALRLLKPYNLNIGIVESNISSAHLWLKNSFHKMESDMEARSTSNTALVEIYQNITSWKTNYEEGLQQSLKIANEFMHFPGQLSRSLESYIRRFPKTKAPAPWLSIPGIQYGSARDAYDTTKELLELFIEIHARMTVMHNKIKSITDGEKNIDLQLHDMDRSVLCHQMHNIPGHGLYAPCVVWDKSTEAIIKVHFGRRAMLAQDITWFMEGITVLKDHKREIRGMGWRNEDYSEGRAEEMVVFNDGLVKEAGGRLREYFRKHYW